MRVWLSILLCLLAGKAAAQSTATSAALSPELIEIRQAGYEALYNLDYATARAKFSELRERAPQHPTGDLNLAVVIWMEHLDRTRRLQTTLYTQEGFYAGGTKSEGDQIDATVDRAFREAIEQAEAKAKKLLDAAPKDPDALYFLGAVYGMYASYEATAVRKFMAAMRHGARAREQHKRVIELRPDAYDAYLTVGLHDYIIGSLPGFVRFLVGIIGVRGNKERGIEELRTVVEQGRYNREDAAVVLLAVYQREGRPQDALPLLEKLSKQFPRNYLMQLEMASTLNRLGRADKAYATFDALLQDPNPKAEDLIRYQYGEALALKREYARAVEQFIAVNKAANPDQNLVTWAMLRTAQSLDLCGQRDAAVEHYRQVIARPNVYDSREQAERGLKNPFKETPVKP